MTYTYKDSVSAHGREREFFWESGAYMLRVSEGILPIYDADFNRIGERHIPRIFISNASSLTMEQAGDLIAVIEAARWVVGHWQLNPYQQKIIVMAHVECPDGIICTPGMQGKIIEHPYSGIRELYLIEFDEPLIYNDFSLEIGQFKFKED